MTRHTLLYVSLLCLLSLALAPPAQAQQLPRVVVLATGGTIASTYDEATGALRAALTGEEVVAAVEGLSEIARVSVEQVANVNSRDMTPVIWLDLAARANTLLAESDVAGIVVTHGTDTLEETAYFLDLVAFVLSGGDKENPAFKK